VPELTQAAANALKQELSKTPDADGVRLSATTPARDTGLPGLRVEVVDRAGPGDEATVVQGVSLFLAAEVAGRLTDSVLDVDSGGGELRLVLSEDDRDDG
jgi:Fe-S cluster assembly iron-binding protein IscA